jgi:ABC-type polysaccharide/polyol phosphate transport system ATPase subunit
MQEVIRLDQVSLWRRTQEEFSYDLKKTMLSVLEGKFNRPKRKLVLDNIDLVIERGDKLGIIGPNGSGKSTLLKVISGILEPTHGTLRVRGNIAPLIELGAGFDVELSVFDNIVMYGVMLGFSRREMQHRALSILDFAELNDYHLAPVKALSSGMTARLGFAIATDVHPDILILDEVLSVGDESFMRKCQKRLDAFWQDHVTVLVVSHSMDFIRESCNRCIFLANGSIQAAGDAKDIVDQYLDGIVQP